MHHLIVFVIFEEKSKKTQTMRNKRSVFEEASTFKTLKHQFSKKECFKFQNFQTTKLVDSAQNCQSLIYTFASTTHRSEISKVIFGE